MHRRWLAGLRFEHAVHHVVLEDFVLCRPRLPCAPATGWGQ
jgi:hypothetical protein